MKIGYDYLIGFAAFYIIWFPFTVKTHNFTFLNPARRILESLNLINPYDVFHNQFIDIQIASMRKTCITYYG